MNTFQSNKILHFLQSQSLSLSLACYLIIPIHLNEKMLNRSSQILASVVNQIDLEKRGDFKLCRCHHHHRDLSDETILFNNIYYDGGGGRLTDH